MELHICILIDKYPQNQINMKLAKQNTINSTEIYGYVRTSENIVFCVNELLIHFHFDDRGIWFNGKDVIYQQWNIISFPLFFFYFYFFIYFSCIFSAKLEFYSYFLHAYFFPINVPTLYWAFLIMLLGFTFEKSIWFYVKSTNKKCIV